jgi:SAM-dependent methyltransferase
MDLNEIREHWEKSAQEFETGLRATTKSMPIKRLEIAALHKAIKKTHLYDVRETDVLEVGCGNGYNCFLLSEVLPNFNFTGVDYVSEMIKNAKKFQANDSKKYSRIAFHAGNILNLENNKNLKNEYPIIFTDRCIINLNTTALQLEAIDQLSKKVAQNGYLIILENFTQPYKRQNDFRKSVGLPERVPAEYNLFIDEDLLVSHITKSMELVLIDDFGSLHDILLYVLVPMVNGGKIDYDNPVVKAATELSISISEKYDNPFGSFGQNRLFLFHKRVK